MNTSRVNADSNICFDVAIDFDDFSGESKQAIADVFSASHVELTVSIERCELTIERF